ASFAKDGNQLRAKLTGFGLISHDSTGANMVPARNRTDFADKSCLGFAQRFSVAHALGVQRWQSCERGFGADENVFARMGTRPAEKREPQNVTHVAALLLRLHQGLHSLKP